jgi:hypothetical protein
MPAVKSQMTVEEAPWEPHVNKKQRKQMALCHPRPGKPKYVLFSGPRYSTKTYCAMNCIVDHAWSVRDAKLSCISPTVTVASDSGFWWLLTQIVIPQWIAGGFGLEWVTEPKQSGATKKLYCEITNKFGGKSGIQLDSLQYEDEAEARFKNKMYSMIYVSELSYYKKMETFKVFEECLRGPECWEESDFLFLGDTNPAEEGEDSWIWKEWYDFRVRDDVTDRERIRQKQMRLVEFTIYDNDFISQERLEEQLAKYDFSEDLRARYRDGKWVKAVGNSVFFDTFRPLIHVLPNYISPSELDPEILIPEENCAELCTGWDIGDVNHGMVIAEKIFIKNEKDKEVSLFKFLDEVVHIGSNYSTRDFVSECMEKILFWEELLGHPILWRNWSDRSAFSRRDRLTNTYDHQLVALLSGGRVILQAADQTPGSIRQRVILNKKILFENRMVISRGRCPHLIDSYQSLRAGKAQVAVDTTSKFKHAWDAASYLIQGEAVDEIIRPREDYNMGRVGGLVSVPL